MDLPSLIRQIIILVCLSLGLLSNAAIADDRQVVDFYYDSSGNLIEKNTNVTLNSLAPAVSAISPSVVRRNSITTVTIDGSDLKNIQLSTDDSGLTVSNIASANTQVTFDLHVTTNVPLGLHTLVLSTLSGQIAHNIEVFPQLPQMVIRPSPLALAVGTVTEVIFGIGSVDVVDHQITVSIADQTVISGAVGVFSIIAGERFPAGFLQVTGLKTGTTTLTFSSQELGDQVFTVVVGNAYQPPLGTKVNVRSDLLGIVLPSNSPDINEIGPLTSSLSIFLTPVIAPDVSVRRQQLSSLLNVVYGSAFTEVTPKAIAASNTSTLTIKGHGLSAVTGLTIDPVDGITLGGLQINPTGTEITVPVTIASDISFSIRSVQLLTASSEIKPIHPEVRQLYVGGQIPSIESITPVVVSRLSTQTLNVTGQYFDGDIKVNVTPPDDINIGNRVTVNGNHTKLSVDLNVDENAALGQRVITVETLNGVTKQTSLPTNTLTIANGIAGEVPVTSVPLGIVVGTSNTVLKTVSLFSPELGIVRGTGVSAVQPLKATRDTVVTLTVAGFGLDNVTAVNFEPAQGITVTAPQIAADGLSFTVDVTIAADAQTTTRLLSVVASGTNLAFIDPEVSRFAILGPVPQINYISPNFIVAGNTATINVHGQSFEMVDSVRIEPIQGFTVSVPQINADNTLITVQVTADTGVQLGAHTLIVGSNAGESSSAPSAENQLNVVSTELLTINNSLVSPLLGISVGGGNAGTVTRDFTITSDLLGVIIPKPPTVTIKTQYSSPLSVVKGGYLQTIAPDALEVGTTTAVMISGVDLQDVTAIEFIPADGLSVLSPITITPDATQASVDVLVAINADKSKRRIVVHQNGVTNNALPYVKAESAIIEVAGGLPTIDSISPVLQVPNSQFELLVRGQNLQEVTAVHAYDSSGAPEDLISFGAPVISPDGTELRVIAVVERLVPSGAKAIVLTVAIGQTGTAATPVNTLTIDTLTP